MVLSRKSPGLLDNLKRKKPLSEEEKKRIEGGAMGDSWVGNTLYRRIETVKWRKGGYEILNTNVPKFCINKWNEK